jgi:hypothetical protein
MRRALPMVLMMLVGCTTVYRGSNLNKVVLTEHSAIIERNLTFLKSGQATEAIHVLEECARDRAKLEENHDKVQTMLEASLKVGGRVKSYQIVEAEKYSDEGPGPSGDGTPSSKRAGTHEGLIVRVKVEFEHGTGDFSYKFVLIDGIWKSSGFGIGFQGDSE